MKMPMLVCNRGMHQRGMSNKGKWLERKELWVLHIALFRNYVLFVVWGFINFFFKFLRTNDDDDADDDNPYTVLIAILRHFYPFFRKITNNVFKNKIFQFKS